MGTAKANPIVAIAAEGREFKGLLRHASGVSRLDWPIEFARSAEIHGVSWLLAANGPGPRLAAEAAEAATRGSTPAAVVSTGFCGALDPDLRAGDILVAREVEAREQGRTYAARPVENVRRHATGTVVSMDRVVWSAREKSELRAGGGSAVEMEAAAVAQAAERSGAPYYCVRVISDAAGEEMPLDFNSYRDRDGRFSRGRIARAALLRPAALAGLLRLEANCRRAAIQLGDFLADCRF